VLAAQISFKNYRNLNKKKKKNSVMNILKPTAKKQTKNLIYNDLCSKM